MGAQVSIPDINGSDWTRSAQLCAGLREPNWLPDSGVECTGGPRTSVGEGAAEGVDIPVDGNSEGEKCLAGIYPVSASEGEALLGQFFLGKGILCGYGGIRRGNDTHICKVSGEAGATPSAIGSWQRMMNWDNYSQPSQRAGFPKHPYRVQKASPRSKNADV